MIFNFSQNEAQILMKFGLYLRFLKFAQIMAFFIELCL